MVKCAKCGFTIWGMGIFKLFNGEKVCKDCSNKFQTTITKYTQTIYT